MTNLAVVYPPERGQKIKTPKTRVRSGTLPSGITAKMDAFARHVAEGLSLADAYRGAFNTTNMKARTVSNDASRLARHPGVTAAIEVYRADNEARNRVLALERDERIWARLWYIIEAEEVAPAVKVKALHLAARLCGMFEVRRSEVFIPAHAVKRELLLRLSDFEPSLT